DASCAASEGAAETEPGITATPRTASATDAPTAVPCRPTRLIVDVSRSCVRMNMFVLAALGRGARAKRFRALDARLRHFSANLKRKCAGVDARSRPRHPPRR